MNGCRQSDTSVVPEKFPNKPCKTGAEEMEGRDVPKENEERQNTHRTQCRESVQSKLLLIHQKANEDKKMKFTCLMHHIYNVDLLRMSYLELKRNASPGIDGETWETYGKVTVHGGAERIG
jgi:RNA-directed DNA polymerase